HLNCLPLQLPLSSRLLYFFLSILFLSYLSFFLLLYFFFFFFTDPATTEIYTLSLHDALPICVVNAVSSQEGWAILERKWSKSFRSEEHTSELQSRFDLVCRLLLEKKKKHKRRKKSTKKKK